MLKIHDGLEPIDQTRNVQNKRFVKDALDEIAHCAPENLATALSAAYANGASWRGSLPFDAVAPEALASTVWQPLKQALPDMERRDDIIAGGAFRGAEFVATTGHYLGTFKRPFIGIPPTGQPVFLRYGEVHRVEGGRIVQSTCLWDVLDLIRQAGYWPLAPSWGTECRWPGPITADGLMLSPQNMDEGLASIRQTLAMHKTLADYDDDAMAGREGLLAMPQREHWHEKMMWYGPAGIGTNRGLSGFVDFHQLPFRRIWPNRRGGAQLDDVPGAGHYIRIGDGHYSVTGGWPSVIANHVGGAELFGSGPTGRRIEMRVMDFYNHHEGLIRENWVPIDMIHLLKQMDIDVLARMRDQFGPDRLGLRD